jgi:CBS domain containing-hemolysin-like protein
MSFIIALAAATYLHMLLGEMIPKNVALAAPEETAASGVSAVATVAPARTARRVSMVI